MMLKKFKCKIRRPSLAIGLILLAFTQVPLAINETLKLACFATTWADYADFWHWEDIPLDARVRYCQGGTKSKLSIKKDSSF